MTTYPKIFEVAESAAQLIVKVKDTVQNPMAMYELTEGEFRDLTFATSLPNEPHPALLPARHGGLEWILLP